MRLFYALWPDAQTQRDWHAATAPLVARWGGRRLPAASLHLTLHFLGEIPADRVGRLTALGEAAAAESISLRFDRLETWSKAGVACLRPSVEPPGLTRLVGYLGSGLALEGFAVEKRRFKAHVTLARHITAAEPALPLWPALEWQADTLSLVRSRLGPDGADYSVIGRWPLR